MVNDSAKRRAGAHHEGDDDGKPLLSQNDDEKKKPLTTEATKRSRWGYTVLLVAMLGAMVLEPDSIPFSGKSSLLDNRYKKRFLTDYHDICIVGAGLSGAVIAERYASQRNQTALIIERRDHIGGNCYDYIDKETGIRVSKYGAHLFHTYYERVWKYVQLFSDWTPYEHEVIGWVEGKHVPIPVNIDTVNSLFGLSIKNPQEMDKWLAEEQVKYPNGPQNSEEMAMSRVGKRLYELIFHPYTIKQWAKEPRELGPEVTARIPVRNDFDRLYFSDPFQALPTNGYTAIFEKIFDNPLISVFTNTDFFDVRPKLKCGKLYYTGPVDRYFADTGLKKLEYRSLDFERKVVKSIDFFQPKGVVNHPAAQDNFTRIVEYKHFLNQTSKHTVLFYEHSKDTGEPYYPVPNPENQELFAKYKAMSDAENDVTFVGRLANYKYFNMDQTIENALTLFDQDTGSLDLVVNHCEGDLAWVTQWQSQIQLNMTYVYSSCGNEVKLNGKGIQVKILEKGADAWTTHMGRKDLTFASQNVFVESKTQISADDVRSSLKSLADQKVFVDFARLPFQNCESSGCQRNLVPEKEFFATHEAIKRYVASAVTMLRGKH
jgi:UDP-galactopyranose mutase